MEDDKCDMTLQFCDGTSPLKMIFRNPARCSDCKVKRRTVFSSTDTGTLERPGAKEMISLEKNAVLIEAGAESPFVYCIRDGWCRLLIDTPGRKKATLWYAGPGDMLGLSSACTGEPNMFTIVAVSKVSVCRIAAASFRDCMNGESDVTLRVAEALSSEISRLEKRTDALRIRFVQKETARVILRLFKRKETGEKKVTFDFLCGETRFGHTEIKHCLNLFRLGKLIVYRNEKMRIRDKDRLMLVAMNDEEWR